MTSWLKRRGAVGLLTAAVLLLDGATALLAQEQPGGGSVFEEGTSRNWIVDGFIVVLVMAGALFAVCRTSNRS